MADANFINIRWAGAILPIVLKQENRMDKNELKKRAIQEIDKAREEIIALGTDIYQHPETGYREFRTTDVLAEKLAAFGLHVQKEIAYTGCKAALGEKKDGPTLAVMGELDSLLCSAHKDANPENGYMHACGHNIQVSVMYAVAAALVRAGILPELDGNVEFLAVPAEEYIEMDYRSKLKKEGKIKYYAGKAECIYRGVFDDIDMAIMAHNYPISQDGYKCAAASAWNGFIGKQIRFIGKPSHAGGAPWDGINALNMADLAMTGMHFQRETFRDDDKVRMHGIITKGGEVVNAVPDDVEMEYTVRARNITALKDANAKVNRAIHGAAITIGGKAVVVDTPGQMPLKYNKGLADLYSENAKAFYKEEEILPYLDTTASTDAGDVSLLMPVLHSLSSGITGGLHSKEYTIVDTEDAYITPAKIFVCMVIDLLYDGAGTAQKILADYTPELTKEQYLEMLDSMENTFEYEA